MSNLKGLVSVVSQLREQRTNLVNDLRHVDSALSVLSKLNGGTNHTHHGERFPHPVARGLLPPKDPLGKSEGEERGFNCTKPKPAKRTMSASARRKIAAAQEHAGRRSNEQPEKS